MEAIADLADRYSFGELRVSHEQNLVLADVRQSDLVQVWREARRLGLATPNLGLLTNIIACPGGDFCALANAKSIPVAEAIQRRFDDLDYLHDIGELDLNISGCMNACGHHHVGHIGILGVDKNGEEWYQIEIGGNQGEVRPGGAKAALGKVIGPSVARAEVPGVIELLRERYGYKGELRAVGPLTRDHLFFLESCGFDAFELRDGEDPHAALAAFDDFSEAYQASPARPQPLFRRRA